LNLDPGEIASAEHGSAELVSSAGLGLHLGGGTRLSVSGLIGNGGHNQVELRQGSLVCSVPHLSEGQHFSVATPDARVVVHGTVFSVQVDPQQNAGQRTCVRVTDGVVIVQHGNLETALNAGDSWGCTETASDDPSGVSHAPPAGNEEEPEANRAELHRAAPHANERGTLSDENRLFQAALAAERVGQKAKAEQTLNRLLTKYPSSPLASEARRALARVAGAAGEK
jgi:TolA-binding protein